MTAWWGLVGLHLAAAALAVLATVRRRAGRPIALLEAPWFARHAVEPLLLAVLCLGLFSYLYAANAGMDYVQRFIASGGDVRLAPDTRSERLAVALRFGPLVAADVAWLARSRRRPPLVRGRPAREVVGDWALPLALVSALLYALALPSFAAAPGLAPLAWICLVPLFVALEAVPYGRGVFLGTGAGALATILVNYWLATFSLVSLQLAAAIGAVQYALFMAAALAVAKRAPARARFLVLPAAWVVFDWVKSLGFLGYPWAMIGTSQYAHPVVIQAASLAGVWAVSFLVLLVNAVAAGALSAALRGARQDRAATLTLFLAFVLAFAWGSWRLAAAGRSGGGALAVAPAGTGAKPEGALRVALVQQNSDPRKHDYASTWETLRRLSDEALAARPDLLAWSETAFVPNIRRWGAMAADEHPYAALVHDLLAWQRSTGTWLLTGNDDYELETTPSGEVRRDYNASILFSPAGERVATYHKIRLVPFTEHFPWRRELPGLYELLMRFDVHLWEPGTERVVFRVPGAAFSTPICFEDAFPGEVRAFVRAGARLVVNLSNDYWSLTEVEALQHAANAVFRAVENGVPMVRATASGLTCAIDPVGRIVARAPLYEEATVVVDVRQGEGRATPYTRWGDWFPPALAALLAALLAAGLAGRRRRPGPP